MGVHGLWELLAPVGRRVSVETLAGKRVAIDASIWIIQFMKAMRDEKGEMVRNAHILGFFRRICKLLYLRTKPVFVFDGGTPALKRRTVIARRRQRENAQAKIRKTAEKLLLNHLKTMRLKELAADLEKQRQENDIKGKRPVIEEPSTQQVTGKGNDDVAVNYSQEELDELLAASLAAEENEVFNVDASASGSGIPDNEVFGDGEDEDDDEDEEMILPEMNGKVDPAILAALPPSMQLDLLVQMRERLMAENRQKYQKVKKAPAKFSELQIEAYLKTVAFRREIDEAQKAAAGRGIGGMQTSRIASEANREFIFSSSFTGDKQSLTSAGVESAGADQTQPPLPSYSTNKVKKVSPVKSGATGPAVAEPRKDFHDDVETYLDERGHLRVSRVRALGIRMTRDLQRNLDLMKEIDQEKAVTNMENINESTTAKNPIDVLDNSSSGRFQNQEIADENNDEVDKIEDPAVVKGNTIEISFEDLLENNCGNDDDDKLFACLVAGGSVMDFSVDNSASLKQSSDADDCEWEEGIIEEKSTACLYEGGMSDEGEDEWKDGFQNIQMKSPSYPDESQRTVTKGDLEEEADFQEAIRRSLEGTMDIRSVIDFHGAGEMVCEPEVEGISANVSQPFQSTNVFESNCSEVKPAAFIELNLDKSHFDLKLSNKDAGESGALGGEIPVSSDVVPDGKGLSVTDKQLFDSCGEDGNGHAVNELECNVEVAYNTVNSASCSAFTDSVHDKTVVSGSTDAQNMSQGAVHDHSGSIATLGKISADDSITVVDGTKELAKENFFGKFSMEKQEVTRNQSLFDDNKEHDIVEDRLEEEMLFLSEERQELGSEQRKHERNAESVTNEMFAECQELLQMFGLPYIIAPMEAEAQCAFMELSNLVDGVVTDDSDAFLFGARNVYKNIFDDRKYVETYLMKDIENELGLDREKLIRMALLLGSDYTEGISGIGIVNAIEVVNAFPGKDGLREFREWIESPDPTILGNFNVEGCNNSRRKGSKGRENISSGSTSNLDGIYSEQTLQQPVGDAERVKQTFMNKHRNVSKNWHISSSFPSDAVITAYASPQVDKSTESLAWGKPDLFVLRKLCWEKLGWGTSKADELLLPVLKEYNKHETQLRLEAFYTFNERFVKIRSKRIKKAVKGIAGHKSSELMDETPLPQNSGSGKKQKVKPCEEEEASQSGAGTQNNTNDKPAVKQLKRGRAKEKTSDSNLEQSTSVRKKSHVRGRGRGRGRCGGRGRGRDTENSCSADTENSSNESDEELQFDKSDETRLMRRSRRLRKAVDYTDRNEFDNHRKESEDRLKEDLTVNESISNEVNRGSDVELEGKLLVEEIQETFRTDKMSTNQVDDNQMDNRSNLREDYIQFGGGFCLEEEDEDNNIVVDGADLLVQENDGSNGPSNEKTDFCGTEMNIDGRDSSDDQCPKSLRAMPNLRRKRRKT